MGVETELESLVLDTSEVLPLLHETGLGRQCGAVKHIPGVLVINIGEEIYPVLEQADIQPEVILVGGLPFQSGVRRA